MSASPAVFLAAKDAAADLADLAPTGPAATGLAIQQHRSARYDADPDVRLHALARLGRQADTVATRWAAVVASWLLSKSSRHTRDAYARDIEAWSTWLDARGRAPWEAERDDAVAYMAHLSRAYAPRSAARMASACASAHGHACAVDPDLVHACDPFHRLRRPDPAAADDDGERVVTVALHELHPEARGDDPDQVVIGRDVDALRRIEGAAWEMGEDHGASVSLLIRGCRAGEIGGITASDVDQVGADLIVTVTRKGGRRDRITATGRVAALLVDRAATADGPLLRTPTGLPMDRHAVTRTVARAARRAGIAGTVTPHVLRATVATLLLLDGTAPLQQVQTMLGHRSTATTLRYSRRRSARGAVTALDALLGSSARG